MKISKELEWMREYIELARPYVPLKKLKSIRGITAPNNLRRQKTHATITSHPDGTFTLSMFKISKKVNAETKEIKWEPYSSLELLATLAHELAHMISMVHCTKHKRMELKLFNLFLTKLNSKGYISEEQELKEMK